MKHKILSKLYFNTIHNIGNLRLMFVISVICAFVCLVNIYDDILRESYYFKISSNNITTELINNVDSYHLKDDDLETFYQLRTLDACHKGDIKLAQQLYLGHYVNGAEECAKLVNMLPNGAEKIICSFEALWKLLWAVFWFYLPFLIVLPFKFVRDGYMLDKRKK